MEIKQKEYPVILFQSSTAVVQLAVNQLVVGSIPASGASFVNAVYSNRVTSLGLRL